MKPDDCVYVRNFSSNSNQKWLPGIILKQRGPVSYVVKLTDGRMFRRHQDHVRLRHDTGLETDSAAEFPVVRPTTVEVGPQETERQAEASGSSREDEHSHTDIQTPLSFPTPDPPKTPAGSAGSPGLVRRSQHTRKPPDRLNV